MSVLSSPQIILQLISPNDSSIDPRRATRHQLDELQEVRYPRFAFTLRQEWVMNWKVVRTGLYY